MNQIRLFSGVTAKCRVEREQDALTAQYRELLGDESKLQADRVESIYFPTSVAEVAWAVEDIRARAGSCVISAGRTGLAGGAAPLGAASIISLTQFNRPLGVGRDGGDYYIRVEPGLSLATLTGLLMKKDFSRLAGCTPDEETTAAEIISDPELQLWFPVNPTETSAQIGGIVATNASGARSYRYGATRQWVRALTVVLADGSLLRLRRGEVTAEDGRFELHGADGSVTEVALENIILPATTKATLGYPLQAGMDLIDLFIGSEGTLGTIVEVELRLVRRPDAVIGVLVIVPDEGKALQLVTDTRSNRDVQFDAIEYFDPAAFLLLRNKRETDGRGSHIPDLPSWDGCGVYFEISGSEEQTDAACSLLEEILDGVGLSLENTWAALEPSELAAQRVFRHALPEAVNSIIGQRKAACPGLHKVGTDMAVPVSQLHNVLAMYRRDLTASGIDSVVFGHIGDNHLHVNLLPRDMRELELAKNLYLAWAKQVVAMGGAVAAEHGIGRLKKKMLEIQYPPSTLELMRRVRRAFDPQGLFAPGVLFDRQDC